ncbi:FAD:protein FMN transferase [Cetobacterium sp.]|uniref:FAD:protein FMN transferase n=2 Tax=Cetobacterium sp. TaxID=2071632 RepID=UPI002FC64D24
MSKSRNIFLLFLLFLLLLGCKKKIERVDEERFAFGTYFKISVYSDNKKEAKKIIDKAFDEIQRIDEKYNSKVSGSLMDELNKNQKATFDDEGILILNEVKKAYNISGGKYDVTMSPLMTLWGFSEEVEPRTTIPTEEELNQAVKKVDFSKVVIDGNQVIIKEPGITIDTGSFLKGYAVDRAKNILRAEGIKNGFVTAISSIEAIGGKGDGSPWKIGIQNPNNSSDILGIVELRDQSMGVSGDYQTYVEIDGKKYHHILDKETKYPVKDKKMVVVVNKNGLQADLYSTVFFLIPLEKVLEIANTTPDLDVIVVDENDKIYLSKDIKFQKR